jgi:hypothetical protein
MPSDTYHIEQDLPPGLSTWQSKTVSITIKAAVSFQRTFDWPSPNDISNSAAIELGFGEHIDSVRFEVSATDGAQSSQHIASNKPSKISSSTKSR